MDLKTLKLELLERIALLDDQARLLALKPLLDSPQCQGIPNVSSLPGAHARTVRSTACHCVKPEFSTDASG